MSDSKHKDRAKAEGRPEEGKCAYTKTHLVEPTFAEIVNQHGTIEGESVIMISWYFDGHPFHTNSMIDLYTCTTTNTHRRRVRVFTVQSRSGTARRWSKVVAVAGLCPFECTKCKRVPFKLTQIMPQTHRSPRSTVHFFTKCSKCSVSHLVFQPQTW